MAAVFLNNLNIHFKTWTKKLEKKAEFTSKLKRNDIKFNSGQEKNRYNSNKTLLQS